MYEILGIFTNNIYVLNKFLSVLRNNETYKELLNCKFDEFDQEIGVFAVIF